MFDAMKSRTARINLKRKIALWLRYEFQVKIILLMFDIFLVDVSTYFSYSRKREVESNSFKIVQIPTQYFFKQKHEEVYRPEYPAICKDNTTSNVSVSVDIIHIDGLDELNMMFRVKIFILLEWHDSR